MQERRSTPMVYYPLLSFIILGFLWSGPTSAQAQEEVASAIRRYKDKELSTGYYETYEVRPRRQKPFVEIPGVRQGVFPYSPTAASVRVRTRLSDSHQGIDFYRGRRCEDCHRKQARGIHTIRANLTCRQCHGGEPIASIEHYYSPMNPIRRHAYVCSKCHQGASASFASYRVHEPNPALASTFKEFPASLWGPDSLIPRPVDIKQFFQHIPWLLGVSKAPEFDRWGYWEKFDYWAVFWGMSIIGLTGLMLAYPLSATKIIPGWGLNVAFWVHRIEALLAMGHIFLIHFFIGHLRRHSFPMDRSMFEGSAALEALEAEKPAWVRRLKDNGAWEENLVAETGGGMRIGYYVAGYMAIFCGMFLLVGALANLAGVSW